MNYPPENLNHFVLFTTEHRTLPTVKISKLLFFNKLIGENNNLFFHISFTTYVGEHIFIGL